MIRILSEKNNPERGELPMTKEKKQKKLRYLEYYDLQECFDDMYAKSRQGEVFTNLMELISSEENIRLACAVTGKVLCIDEIHCHHKKPISQGGTDEYKNLVIVHIDVHRLIHAVKPETIQAYLIKIKPNKSQLNKINKFRILAGNPAI